MKTALEVVKPDPKHQKKRQNRPKPE